MIGCIYDEMARAICSSSVEIIRKNAVFDMWTALLDFKRIGLFLKIWLV
jgi:hypothetical protein